LRENPRRAAELRFWKFPAMTFFSPQSDVQAICQVKHVSKSVRAHVGTHK
jgi:hypothetical protein